MISEPIDDWDDFVVSTEKGATSSTEMYESYLLFKQYFRSLPQSELMKRGWLGDDKDASVLTDFYRDICKGQEGTLFRKSDTAEDALILFWVSKIKSYAQMKVFTDSIPIFKGLSKDDLKEISQLSVDVDVVKELPSILAAKGIILIYNRALPSMKLDGTVFKLISGHPVVGLSFRYSRLDNFWFTLMHELAHINLHMDLLDNPIIDDLEADTGSEIELEANRLAKYSFIDRVTWRGCKARYDTSFEVLEKFAEENNIHKSIVAGLLSNETGNYSTYNSTVHEVDVRDLVFLND